MPNTVTTSQSVEEQRETALVLQAMHNAVNEVPSYVAREKTESDDRFLRPLQQNGKETRSEV